ncbi:type II toxin-antitoxin system antitoxin SocA domain-containing protein [Aurantimonas sp. A2-1-M11]|uniref:Panacea domain-containing protein n=1 Tax=Aurantimonas sp. A2-1-M11 TaxID=3113712 RepID=UPI002F940029
MSNVLRRAPDRVDSAPYSARHIANYFLDKAESEGRPITQMKLHKLVYIAYGWYIALMKARLFDDRIEAWEHGPVVTGIREEFRNFGREPITVKSIDFDLDTFTELEPEVPSSDVHTHVVLDRVWESYKRFSAAALRSKTHQRGSPWDKAFRDGAGYGSTIDDEDIASHYRERISLYIDAAKGIEQSID